MDDAKKNRMKADLKEASRLIDLIHHELTDSAGTRLDLPWDQGWLEDVGFAPRYSGRAFELTNGDLTLGVRTVNSTWYVAVVGNTVPVPEADIPDLSTKRQVIRMCKLLGLAMGLKVSVSKP